MIPGTPQTSDWPLPEGAARVLLPQALVTEMATDKLANSCYPQAFGYYPMARGHRMARPQPEDWLVIYCVDGSAEATIKDASYSVGAGDLLLLPAGIAHQYAADTAVPWSLYWMHLAGNEVGEWFARLGAADGGVCRIGLHERLLADFRTLLSMPAAGYNLPSGVHAANLARGLLSYAWLLLQRQQQPPSTLDINALHLFMQQHLDRKLSVADLAAHAQQPSRYQFIRQYKAATGQTPIQAFLHMKISRACYLLEVSDASVADIAAQFGVEDAYYFSRLFKKIVGVSPTRYRHQLVQPRTT